MQDRYKFRAWNKKTKTIHNVTEIGFKDYDNFEVGHICMAQGNSEWVALENINNVELMQCTGLKDKNGKLIFEGDIVNESIVGYETTIKSVDWIEDVMAGFNLNNEGDYEIIGNIYENPELLKGVQSE